MGCHVLVLVLTVVTGQGVCVQGEKINLIILLIFFFMVGVLIVIDRQRPALGECLASLAAAIPVAFLEPSLNLYNPLSVFNTKSTRERASKYSVAEV